MAVPTPPLRAPNINPAQFKESLYHGASKDFTHVLPSTQHGGDSNWGQVGKRYGQESSKNAFATSQEHDAWYFAESSADKAQGRNPSEPMPRPRVYEVHPNNQTRPGIYNSSHPRYNDIHAAEGNDPSQEDHHEYVAPHFAVKSQIDIKPGHQGTLNLNWNQFRTTGKSTFWGGGQANNTPKSYGWDDLNHPAPKEQQYGHAGSDMQNDFYNGDDQHRYALAEDKERYGPSPNQMQLPGMGDVKSRTPVSELHNLLEPNKTF